jgi:hypothetical protein
VFDVELLKLLERMEVLRKVSLYRIDLSHPIKRACRNPTRAGLPLHHTWRKTQNNLRSPPVSGRRYRSQWQTEIALQARHDNCAPLITHRK